jgi:RND family efflux transporter MFP subunit
MTLDVDDVKLRVEQAKAQLEQARAALGLTGTSDETLLDRETTPMVREARAIFEQSEENLKRAERLIRDQVMPEEELEGRQAARKVAEAKYRSALNDVEEQVALVRVRRAEVALAEQVLRDASVRAPFDGVIHERHVAPGAYLQIGQPVVTLVRINPLRFSAGVPERDAAPVHECQPVRLRIEGRSEPLLVAVSRIGPSVETSNRTLSIEVDVPNPEFQLRAGLFAEAEIVVDEKAKATVVPASAVQEFAGVEKVWVVRDGEATERAVRTGRREPARIEIQSGLQVGEKIVVDARTGRRGKVTVE